MATPEGNLNPDSRELRVLGQLGPSETPNALEKHVGDDVQILLAV